MKPSLRLTGIVMVLFVLLLSASATMAADPGLAYPPESEATDTKAGSLLYYNAYTSVPAGDTANTKINVTNTNDQFGVAIHVFFVDGSSCSVADYYICLTANQTYSFYASDYDPGFSGYIVMVAVDREGIPRTFNFLTGDEFIRYDSGFIANLGAIAFSKLTDTNVISTDRSQAAIFFDGQPLAGSYNRAPRVVELDSIASKADSNDTLLILNRVGGNLGTGAASLGSLFGLLYDDVENSYSFSISGGCQLRTVLSDTSPRTAPRFGSIIPTGRTGWMKLWSQSDIGILGAMINKNPNQASRTAFNGGHNLHALKLSAAANLVIPVFAPSCFVNEPHPAM